MANSTINILNIAESSPTSSFKVLGVDKSTNQTSLVDIDDIKNYSTSGVSAEIVVVNNTANYANTTANYANTTANYANTKASYYVNVKDFGAVGDGIANDYNAFLSVSNNGKVFEIPEGTYNFDTMVSNNIPSIGYGTEFIGEYDEVSSFKNFIDLGRKSIFRNSYRESTEYANTPTSYTYIRDLTSMYIKHTNGAGYQQFYDSDSGGRTNVPALMIRATHTGYGDCNLIDCGASIGQHANVESAVSWTGRNSISLFGGGASTYTGNTNVYGAEFQVYDNGYKNVAGLGLVVGMYRYSPKSNNYVDYQTPWLGVRVQSPHLTSDVAYQVSGNWDLGLDFSSATLTNGSAIALKTSDKIYFGVPATAPPIWYANTLSNNYITFSESPDRFLFVANSKTPFAVYEEKVATSVLFELSNTTINFGSVGYVANTANSGTASALPATPHTYLTVKIDGYDYKIPVYQT